MTTIQPRVPGRISPERRFYTGMAVAILAAVLLGFSRSFFLRPLFPDWPSPSETIFYVHGAVFSCWILLLVVQTSLVAGGRTPVHRTVGPFGAALAGVMVVLGIFAALVAARRPTGFVDVPVPPLQFLAIPIFDITFFAVFVGLAVAWRREAQSHKRLMLLGTLNLVTAAIARWPMVFNLGPLGFFGLTDLFLAPLVLWDFRTRGRLHPVTLWGGLAIIASQPLRLWVSGTQGWLAFARWATGLLG
jgi:Na+/H+-dicarboxylate symporter